MVRGMFLLVHVFTHRGTWHRIVLSPKCAAAVAKRVISRYLIKFSDGNDVKKSCQDDCPEPEKCFNCRQEGHSSSDCPEPELCRKCRKPVS